MRTGRLRGRGTGYELIEGLATIITDVFVNGHKKKAQRDKAKKKDN